MLLDKVMDYVASSLSLSLTYTHTLTNKTSLVTHTHTHTDALPLSREPFIFNLCCQTLIQRWKPQKSMICCSKKKFVNKTDMTFFYAFHVCLSMRQIGLFYTFIHLILTFDSAKQYHLHRLTWLWYINKNPAHLLPSTIHKPVSTSHTVAPLTWSCYFQLWTL